MLTGTKLAELRKLRAYCSELIAAHEVLAEPAPEAKEAVAVDLAAWKLSQSNRILAGSGEKAELLGTLSTEPTVKAGDLTKLDVYPSTEAELLAARDDIRKAALELRLPVAVPKEIAK
jgi:hypothetical protein